MVGVNPLRHLLAQHICPVYSAYHVIQVTHDPCQQTLGVLRPKSVLVHQPAESMAELEAGLRNRLRKLWLLVILDVDWAI